MNPTLVKFSSVTLKYPNSEKGSKWTPIISKEGLGDTVLKTFLTYLNFMPEVVGLINGRNIINSDIPICQEVAERLRVL